MPAEAKSLLLGETADGCEGFDDVKQQTLWLWWHE